MASQAQIVDFGSVALDGGHTHRNNVGSMSHWMDEQDHLFVAAPAGGPLEFRYVHALRA